MYHILFFYFFFSSRRRHTRYWRDWSSDVCSSDLILTEGGAVHAGCNVENASYGLTICAERNAATSMVSAGPEDRRIRSVAVFSPNASPCFPCGACRQFLREFGCEEVVVEDASGKPRRYPFEEILPNSFGPEDL